MERKQGNGLIFLLLIVIGFNMFLVRKINNLSNEIRMINDNIHSVSSTVSSSINSGMEQLQEIQRQESSIISEFRYEFGDLKAKTVDIKLLAKPKEIGKEDKFYFSYKAGNNPPKLTEALSTDGINFASNINVSIFDNIELDFIIHRGDTKYGESLDAIYSLKDKFTANLFARPRSGTYRRDDKGNFVFSAGYELIHGMDQYNDVSLKLPKFSIIKNGEIIEEFDMEKTDDTHRHMDSVYGEDRYKLELTDYKLAVNPGDTIIFQIHTKDNIGFNYKVNVDGWSILDSKKFESISHDFSMGDYRFMEVIVE